MVRQLWPFQSPLQTASETSIQTQPVVIHELWGNFPKQAWVMRPTIIINPMIPTRAYQVSSLLRVSHLVNNARQSSRLSVGFLARSDSASEGCWSCAIASSRSTTEPTTDLSNSTDKYELSAKRSTVFFNNQSETHFIFHLLNKMIIISSLFLTLCGFKQKGTSSARLCYCTITLLTIHHDIFNTLNQTNVRRSLVEPSFCKSSCSLDPYCDTICIWNKCFCCDFVPSEISIGSSILSKSPFWSKS